MVYRKPATFLRVVAAVPALARRHCLSLQRRDRCGNFENMEMKSLVPTNATADVCGTECFHPRTVARAQDALTAEAKQLAASAELFKTLGNLKRLMILRALRETELCVCDLAHLLGLSMAATSQQLRILRGQGWLRMRNVGKMVYYSWVDQPPLPALETALRNLSGRQP